MCGLVGTSSCSQQSDQGSRVLPHGNVRQPFRPPRTAVVDQRCSLIGSRDAQSTVIGSTGYSAPVRVIRPPTSQQSGTVSSTTGTAGRGSVMSLNLKTSDGTHGVTGPLRQLQITDAMSLPARVKQPLCLGE